jgi:hypothetical protein
METAASELIDRQQAKIQELVKIAEKKESILSNVYSENIEKLRQFEYDLHEDFIMSSPFRESTKSGKSEGIAKYKSAEKLQKTMDSKFNLSTYRFTKDGQTDTLNQSIRSVTSYKDGKTKKTLTGVSFNKTRGSISPGSRGTSNQELTQPKGYLSPNDKDLLTSYRRSNHLFLL